MRAKRLIPIAGLAFAVACSDSATSPTMNPTSVGGPASLVAAGTYTDVEALREGGTPSGGHVQSGTIQCVVNLDFSIDCTSYEIAGVGHTNVDVSLDAVYSADVLCNNPAGGKNTNNDIEPHETTFSASDDFTAASLKNGRLRIRAASVEPAASGNPCPNGNWIPEFVNLALVEFTYSVLFEGFSAPDYSVFIHAE
jgi:hypothetical protein